MDGAEELEDAARSVGGDAAAEEVEGGAAGGLRERAGALGGGRGDEAVWRWCACGERLVDLLL